MTSAEDVKEPRAFVLMPFAEPFDPVYSGLLEPALRAAGYEVTRADSVIDQQNVLRDIITGIDRASLVVADLTGLNPNVFYELGIAHGLGVPTILITQAIDEVPFDLRGYRIQEYSTRFDVASELARTLEQVGREHSQGEVSFGSPVSDFLPGSEAAARLAGGPGATGREREAASPALRAENGGDEEEDEADEVASGFLDLLVQFNDAMNALSPTAEAISSATEEIGSKIEAHTSRLNAITQSGTPEMLSEAHQLAALVAVDLETYADKLKPLISELDAHGSSLGDATPALASRLDQDEPEQRQQLLDFRESLRIIQGAVEPTLAQLSDYRDSFREMRGVTSKLDRAVDRASSEVDRLISTFAAFDAFSARGIEIVNEKVGDSEPDA